MDGGEDGGFGAGLNSPRSPQEVESRRRKQAIFKRHMALRQKTREDEEEGGGGVEEEKVQPVAAVEVPVVATETPRSRSAGRFPRKHVKAALAPYERALAARQHIKGERTNSSSLEKDSTPQQPDQQQQQQQQQQHAALENTPRAGRGSRRKIELVRKLAEKKFFTSRSEPTTPERLNKSEEIATQRQQQQQKQDDLQEQRSASAPRQRTEDAVREWGHESPASDSYRHELSKETNEETIDLNIPHAELNESFLNVTGDSSTAVMETEEPLNVIFAKEPVSEMELNIPTETNLNTSMDSEQTQTVITDNTSHHVEAKNANHAAVNSSLLNDSVATSVSSVETTSSLMEYKHLNNSSVASSAMLNISGASDAGSLPPPSRPRLDVSRLRVMTELGDSGKMASLSSTTTMNEVRSPTKSSCYDMRSVTDDFGDPSWDVSKITSFHHVGTDRRRKHDDYDIFDTASWAEASNVSFGTPRGGQLSPYGTYGGRFEEEKKESTPFSNDVLENDAHVGESDLDDIEQFREGVSPKNCKTAEESPTWNTTKAMFPDSRGKKTDDMDAINMFDAASWAPSSIGNHPDIEAEVSRLMNEGTVAADYDAERDNSDTPVVTAVDKDDVPLLDGEETRSDIADELQTLAMRLLGNLGNHGIRQNKAERVQAYTAQDEKDLSSVEEDAGQVDDESDESDAFDEINYKEQGDEDGNLDEFIASIEQESETFHIEQKEPLIEEYPTFDPAAAAATADINLSQERDVDHETAQPLTPKKSGERARPSPERPPVHGVKKYEDNPLALAETKNAPRIDETFDQELHGEVFAELIPPPPPPPPPGSKKNRNGKKNRTKRSSGDASGVPKIAPPPEEKLRKWEESKMRPFAHLGRVDNTKNVANPPRVHVKTESDSEHHNSEVQQEFSPVHAARAKALESALKRVGSKTGKTDCGMSTIDVLAGSNQTNFPSMESPSRDALSREAFQRPSTSPEVAKKQSNLNETTERQSSSREAVQNFSLAISMRRSNSPEEVINPNAMKLTSKSPDAEQRHSPVVVQRQSNSPDTVEQKSSSPEVMKSFLDATPADVATFEVGNGYHFDSAIVAPESDQDSQKRQLQSSDHSQFGEPKQVFPRGIVDAVLHEDSGSLENVTSPNSGRGDNQIEPAFSVLLARKENSKSPSRSNEKTSPQVTVHELVAGTKMAEKLALASSAAAQKFEEQYVSRAKLDAKHSTESDIKHLDANQGKSQSESLSALSLFCVPQTLYEEEFNVTVGPIGVLDASAFETDASGSKTHVDTVAELSGGAFSTWRKPKRVKTPPPATDNDLESRIPEVHIPRNAKSWLLLEVLKLESSDLSAFGEEDARKLLSDNDNFNTLCKFVADTVNERQASTGQTSSGTDPVHQPPKLQPFQFLPRAECSNTLDTPSVLAANFVSFLHRVAKATDTPSPFGDDNPFLRDIIGSSIRRSNDLHGADAAVERKSASMQDILFEHPQGHPMQILGFSFEVCEKALPQITDGSRALVMQSTRNTEAAVELIGERDFQADKVFEMVLPEDPTKNLNLIVPSQRPSPFETAVWNNPNFLLTVLGFLGDPVAVCRIKVVNRFCNRIIKENEHVVMRDAVRLGGLSMHLRPSFWMWITLEKCGQHDQKQLSAQLSPMGSDAAFFDYTAAGECLPQEPRQPSVGELERIGRTGKWHHVIDRDVSRAFGNMPPHKTGARLRTDSIVRALVTWGRNRIMKRGVRGSGEGPMLTGVAERSRMSRKGEDGSDASEASQTPTDTVSDWGGVSPVGSFTSSVSGLNDGETDRQRTQALDKAQMLTESGRSHSQSTRNRQTFVADEDLALGGNALTEDMKTELQDKLGYILYALAAAHQDVGYCQGMDYVVAHLLRILQDTVLWKAARGTLPPAITSAASISFQNGVAKNIDESHVVEEAVFKVMDTFFTTYNLRHMYWPELRCLKTCCRVFERLIQIKLPVLADHFDHHDLNVGLFALGWFQTLFLYLPSMPSATVCHMWDIWLVERSFKIFFRVGTAILFLSQPILLNHDLEGMMTYLNTFPDATLLNPDILIACALQIKVTNKMLMDIEIEITGGK